MSLYTLPPESVLIDGIEYPINTDFRYWVRFQGVFLGKMQDQEKAEAICVMMAEAGLPQTKEALDAMVQFYVGASTEHGTCGKSVQAFDFEKDSEYIFSAFYEAYHIDLSVEKLHWWRFKSLFKSLPDNCQMCKIMMYRTIGLQNVPKEQRQFYRDMKTRYALSDNKPTTRTEQEMKDYVRKRFEEAKSRMPEMRSKQQPSVDH